MKSTDSRKPRGPGKTSAAADSLQDTFLDDLIRNRTRVTIFLMNGVKIEGEIKSFDRYVILMRNAVSDKVYKHAISTIVPATEAPAASTTIVQRKAPSKLGGRGPK